jgi:crotonobetainyl-CoA:carnitine CoA-transferase CaiB-like acyl-CoA transferase
VLEGIRVLDLSSGVAGPMATMLLADNGADVVKIEPPGGDPTRAFSGALVWHRGKRSVTLDLADGGDRARFHELAETADVVVESFRPGAGKRLGADYATLAALNPALVHCSITGYGRDTRHADRPAYDALVAARTGLHWEQRGWIGGSINRLLDRPPFLEGMDAPDGCAEGAARPGPLFPYSTWPSLGACFLATLGVSAALRARAITGRGQWVETSLLQGVLASTIGGWQRCERPDAPHYQTWVFDPRATKGEFECSDGRWVHHWVPNPSFVLAVSAGDRLEAHPTITGPREDPSRITTDPEEMVVLWHYYPELAERFRRFPAQEWVDVGFEVGVALQPINAPEEALADPALLAEGCVADVGGRRQVGLTYRMAKTPGHVGGPPPAPGEHDGRIEPRPAPNPSATGPLASPLAGIRVLDLGLAVAGPFGTQMLADLGAEVIKVNTLHDGYWHANHIAFICNRGKRSLAVNLKTPEGNAILRKLVETTDVVHHNMRYEAAERLGVDDASLRAIKPDLIYCHTRGFDDSRHTAPGNDQTAAALAGVEWEDGGCSDGGRPIWSLSSFGDTGNGFLSAIAVVQALYHRDRTGEGQFVDTSILNACLLNTSYASLDAQGLPADRPHLDRDQLGLAPWYRLYETADRWLCLAAVEEPQREAFTKLVAPFDEAEALLRTKPAAEWFDLLDAAGVPCEVCDETFALGVFDDPELRARGWVTSYEQKLVGHLDQYGLLIDFSETPGRIAGPPLVVGADTEAILGELGFGAAEIARLEAERVVLVDR